MENGNHGLAGHLPSYYIDFGLIRDGTKQSSPDCIKDFNPNGSDCANHGFFDPAVHPKGFC